MKFTRSLRWLVCCFALAPCVQAAEAPFQTFNIPMRDGIRLATDVYLPSTNGAFPVVLLRSPYSKEAGHGIGQAGVKGGYAMVIQDTRGRFASEGANLPFATDGWADGHRDGADTVDWIAKQSWCNGKISTFGGSALGITQLQLAGSGTDKLTCQHITVGAPNLYDVIYRGGVFRKSMIEDWLNATKFSPEALSIWTSHSRYDDYWRARDVSLHYAQINTPAVHIGGYFDIFAQSTIDAFNGYQLEGGPGARGKQKLLMGPWTHGVLAAKAGDLTFPKGNRPPNNVQDQNRWWEFYLKGISNGIDKLPAVTYYVMGDVNDPQAPGNVWRTADKWPPVTTTTTAYYLSANKTLSTDRRSAGEPLTYSYDPSNPVPTAGGYQLTIPAGPRDQKIVEQRPDVLIFTSAPLADAIEVTGRVTIELFASSDSPDTDFVARLCDVYPDGKSFNICEGIIRARFRETFEKEKLLEPGRVYPFKIDLWSTSIVFNKGHQLRVHITSSSAPGYDPNPNTGEPFRSSNRTRVAKNTIYCAGDNSSRILLPVVDHGTARQSGRF